MMHHGYPPRTARLNAMPRIADIEAPAKSEPIVKQYLDTTKTPTRAGFETWLSEQMKKDTPKHGVIEPKEKPRKLTVREKALKALRAAKRPMTVFDIADATGTCPRQVRSVVAKLGKKGLAVGEQPEWKRGDRWPVPVYWTAVEAKND